MTNEQKAPPEGTARWYVWKMTEHVAWWEKALLDPTFNWQACYWMLHRAVQELPSPVASSGLSRFVSAFTTSLLSNAEVWRFLSDFGTVDADECIKSTRGVLQLFRDRVGSELPSGAGPQPTEAPPPNTPLSDAIQASAQALGLPVGTIIGERREGDELPPGVERNFVPGPSEVGRRHWVREGLAQRSLTYAGGGKWEVVPGGFALWHTQGGGVQAWIPDPLPRAPERPPADKETTVLPPKRSLEEVEDVSLLKAVIDSIGNFEQKLVSEACCSEDHPRLYREFFRGLLDRMRNWNTREMQREAGRNLQLQLDANRRNQRT